MLLRNVSRILKHILNMFNVPLVFIKFIVEYICERTCLKVERTPFTSSLHTIPAYITFADNSFA